MRANPSDSYGGALVYAPLLTCDRCIEVTFAVFRHLHRLQVAEKVLNKIPPDIMIGMQEWETKKNGN